MKLHPESRAQILADMTLDVDPSGSTIEVKVDDAWHAASWGPDVSTRDTTVNGVTVTQWMSTARTVGYFCGPDAAPMGATVLTLGRHKTKTRVTLGGDQLVSESSAIDVKA